MTAHEPPNTCKSRLPSLVARNPWNLATVAPIVNRNSNSERISAVLGFSKQMRMPDDLDDYDVSADEIFNPKKTSPPPSIQNAPTTKSKGADLGLEEIQVTKKRQPIPKLDEER